MHAGTTAALSWTKPAIPWTSWKTLTKYVHTNFPYALVKRCSFQVHITRYSEGISGNSGVQDRRMHYAGDSHGESAAKILCEQTTLRGLDLESDTRDDGCVDAKDRV